MKVRNIRRDPRVSLVVIDTAANGDPLAASGTAEVVETGGDDFTYTMAHRYEGRKRGDREAEEAHRDRAQPGAAQGDRGDHAAAGPDRRLTGGLYD